MPNEGQRIRSLESIEFANLLPVTANPNGSLDSSQGVFAWDATNKNLYINTDGATAWTLVWLGSGGASPLTTKGDLFGFDTADARIPIGADDEILTADSSTALGVSWQAAFSSPLSTKGDLFGFDSADARIPIGADGFILTADSAQALGLKWAAGFSSPLTTKGDLFGFSTVDARLPVGSDGQRLEADSGAALGVSWQAATPLTTKGDLFGFSTIDARIPVGTNDQVLKADSSVALGVSWQAVAPLTTKGDLFGFDTGDARIPIGTNDQVLTADSAQALGLKWSDAFSSPLTTKGDLLVYTTVDARLPVGNDGEIIVADSAESEGLKYIISAPLSFLDQCKGGALRGMWNAGVTDGNDDETDLSGNGHTGTRNGSFVWGFDSSGKYSVADLNGSADYIAIPDHSDFDITGSESVQNPGLTIAMLVNTDTIATGFGGWLTKWTSGANRSYAIYRQNALLSMVIHSGSAQNNVAVSGMSASAWYFVWAKWIPGAELSLWANGSESVLSSGVISSIQNGNAPLETGRIFGTAYHNGKVGWRAIWASAQPDTLRDALYEAAKKNYGF